MSSQNFGRWGGGGGGGEIRNKAKPLSESFLGICKLALLLFCMPDCPAHGERRSVTVWLARIFGIQEEDVMVVMSFRQGIGSEKLGGGEGVGWGGGGGLM